MSYTIKRPFNRLDLDKYGFFVYDATVIRTSEEIKIKEEKLEECLLTGNVEGALPENMLLLTPFIIKSEYSEKFNDLIKNIGLRNEYVKNEPLTIFYFRANNNLRIKSAVLGYYELEKENGSRLILFEHIGNGFNSIGFLLKDSDENCKVLDKVLNGFPSSNEILGNIEYNIGKLEEEEKKMYTSKSEVEQIKRKLFPLAYED